STSSTATANTTDPSDTPPTTINTNASTPLVSSPPTPTVSISSPDDHLPRRIKSKSSLRSIRSFGSSHNEDEADDSSDAGLDKNLVRPSILRRLSPGLAARVKLLDGSNAKVTTPSRVPGAVGRIPEEQLKELDNLHQERSIKIERKGRSWNVLQGLNKEKGQQGASDHLEVLESDWDREIPVEHIQQQEPESEPEPAPEPELESQPQQQQQQEEPEPEPEQQSAQASPTVVDRVESLADLGGDHIEVTPVDTGEVASPHETPASEVQEVEGATAAMSAVSLAPTPLAPEPEQVLNTENPSDFEKYVQSTTEDDEEHPPPPPPKDSPPPPSSATSSQSYFNPRGLQRTESIYSFSRASFSNQLSQLTSISLPQPSSLEASISGISNAPAAVKALTSAAEQIQIWIRKATDVLGGLDAEDDVEWAAAGGREGLDGVDNAIARFESLVNVYVKAIEDVQLRDDIGNVSTDSLNTIVIQMESILRNWVHIKGSLKGVKGQVELAMEWEELWGTVLGDVGLEADSLGRLIFEMEEKRHWSMSAEQESSNGLDINELETIVEETPSNGHMASNKRFSVGPIFATPTLDTPIIQTPQDDSSHSNLMALFARMQPLRASLDFLPMRMSMFQARAESIFPSACQELEERRSGLEKSYKALETDAESLRKELSEDRWILVFRNAGGQAQKMFESVERSISKLQEGLETGAHLNNPAGLTKRIESYEAKKLHYVPAIERVVTIIQKGVDDRLTVNGETLRLLSDMMSRTDALKASIRVMDSSLDDMSFVRGQHLRDSISSIVTMDSPATTSVPDTPGSSPASSVVMTPANGLKGSATPMGTSSRRASSVGSSTARAAMSKVRRYSGLPQAAATLTNRKSSIPKPLSGTPSPTKNRAVTPTPASRRMSRVPQSPIPNRPRWNGSTNTNDLQVGHLSRPSMSNLSQHRKSSAPGHISRPSSTLPLPNPFRRDQSVSPAPPAARSASRVSSRLASRSPAPARMASPTPTRSILDPPPYSKLRKPPVPTGMSNAPRNRSSFAGTSFSRSVSHNQDTGMMSPQKTERPGTSLGHSANRRISLLPLPKGRSGRDSAAGSRP
ncbi:hypothetical protein ASPWEDRAFT_83536, partial [Aspergillus wentii DTO 134E9]